MQKQVTKNSACPPRGELAGKLVPRGEIVKLGGIFFILTNIDLPGGGIIDLTLPSRKGNGGGGGDYNIRLRAKGFFEMCSNG